MQSLRLLLIEDFEADAFLIREVLNTGGYNVVAERVEDSAGMLKALREQEFDVVISDYNLPAFSGKEALMLMLEHGYQIPFVVVSGAIGEETAVDLMKSGAHDYLMKSNLSRLVPAVKNAIRAGELQKLNTRAEQELKDSREKLRELSNHLENVREQDRANFARDLHDAVGANLTTIKMDMAQLHKCYGHLDQNLNSKLESITHLVNDSIIELRKIISELRPSILDHLGLVAAIEWQTKEFGKRYGIEMTLSVDKNLEKLRIPEEIMIAIFRMFQESLTNIAKHANASNVYVSASCFNNHIRLLVKDNGCGFNPSVQDSFGHYGLLGLKERASNLQGSIAIKSAIGQGVSLSIKIPLARNIQ